MQKAFTLIELLVVVAVVALMIGLALPAFRSVRDNAREVKCRANQKQIYGGLVAYVQTDRKLFPLDVSSSVFVVTPEDATAWSLPAGVFRCPEDRTGAFSTYSVLKPYFNSFCAERYFPQTDLMLWDTASHKPYALVETAKRHRGFALNTYLDGSQERRK